MYFFLFAEGRLVSILGGGLFLLQVYHLFQPSLVKIIVLKNGPNTIYGFRAHNGLQ